MTARNLYIKLTGILLVVIGLSYSVTSLNNLFNYLYGNITLNNGYLIVMIMGITVPMFVFIFGIFYFVYYDSDITNVNKTMLILSLLIMVFGIIVLILKNGYIVKHLFSIAQIFYFVHPSFGFLAISGGVLATITCLKYKL